MRDGRSTQTRQDTARFFLKAATEAAHDKAHQLELMDHLANCTISRAGYRTLMQRLYAYYAVIDQRIIAGCAETGINSLAYAYEPRAPMIAHDLHAMNTPYPADNVADTALPMFPRLSSPAEIAGAAYVVEGALLGARLLERALPTTIAPPPARTFWKWSATAGSNRWSMTRAFIESACPEPAARDQACGVALLAFTFFHAVLGPAPTSADAQLGPLTII